MSTATRRLAWVAAALAPPLVAFLLAALFSEPARSAIRLGAVIAGVVQAPLAWWLHWQASRESMMAMFAALVAAFVVRLITCAIVVISVAERVWGPPAVVALGACLAASILLDAALLARAGHASEDPVDA